MAQPIGIDERVAMALWRYEGSESSMAISWIFGVGKSMCTEAYFEATCEGFGPKFFATLSREELERQAELFERGHGFPMCIGPRDGSHTPIWAHLDGRSSCGVSKVLVLLFRYKQLLGQIIVFLQPGWVMYEILMKQHTVARVIESVELLISMTKITHHIIIVVLHFFHIFFPNNKLYLLRPYNFK